MPPLPRNIPRAVHPLTGVIQAIPGKLSKVGDAAPVASDKELDVLEWYERKATGTDPLKRLAWWQFTSARAMKNWGLGHMVTESQFDAAVKEACGVVLGSTHAHDAQVSARGALPAPEKVAAPEPTPAAAPVVIPFEVQIPLEVVSDEKSHEAPTLTAEAAAPVAK